MTKVSSASVKGMSSNSCQWIYPRLVRSWYGCLLLFMIWDILKVIIGVVTFSDWLYLYYNFYQAGSLALLEGVLVFSQKTSQSHLQPRTTTAFTWIKEMSGGKAWGIWRLPVHMRTVLHVPSVHLRTRLHVSSAEPADTVQSLPGERPQHQVPSRDQDPTQFKAQSMSQRACQLWLSLLWNTSGT